MVFQLEAQWVVSVEPITGLNRPTLSRRLVLGGPMTHHRGLIITLVIAAVVGAAFIGVMAAATNDTHKCVIDDAAADGLGPVLIEASGTNENVPQSHKALVATGGRGYDIETVSIVGGRVTRPCPPPGNSGGTNTGRAFGVEFDPWDPFR